MINKIQQILIFVKAKFMSKQATDVIEDFAMIFKSWTKKKTTSKNKCFNYRKLGNFEKDYIVSNIHKKNMSNELSNNGQQ